MPQATSPGTPLHGPHMGTYDPSDVTWLIHDATQHVTNSPSGTVTLGPSNTTILPVENGPEPSHVEFFLRTTKRSARQLAITVGVMAEMALRERGTTITFASIIRAGIPVGILAHRWLHTRYSIPAKHYAMSIIPIDGLDHNALDYIAQHHNPSDVMFVDGWTGRGSITLEVAKHVRAAQARGMKFLPDLAVMVDPSHCSTVFGTRDDMLLPAAVLDTTATGMTTKTFWDERFTSQGHFHAVAQYPRHHGVDYSRWYVDEISSHFTDVRDDVDARVTELLANPPHKPVMTGKEAVDAFAHAHGITDVLRVKAGIGESCRGLIFGPGGAQLFARTDHTTALNPVLELAALRGITPQWVDDLAFESMVTLPPYITADATTT